MVLAIVSLYEMKVHEVFRIMELRKKIQLFEQNKVAFFFFLLDELFLANSPGKSKKQVPDITNASVWLQQTTMKIVIIMIYCRR